MIINNDDFFVGILEPIQRIETGGQAALAVVIQNNDTDPGKSSHRVRMFT